MKDVIEYQEHPNSHSEIVDFTGFVGLRPMEHSSLNIYENVKKGKKMFMMLKIVKLVKRENLIKAT